MGVFFGPAQAASRSLMGRLAPRGREAEMFGLCAFAGKSTAFLGPWLYGVVVLAAAGHRWGMVTVVPFLIVGALILLTVVGKPSDAENAS